MQDSFARHLNLAGAANFRDLGGYPTEDGCSVRWRRIFRSNHLGRLTDRDIAALRELGLKTAFDFRGTQERQSAPCSYEALTVHSLAVEPETVATLRQHLQRGPLTEDDTREIMGNSYRNYVRQNSGSFRRLFALLIEDHAPLVIHCTAGKDRTGFASALILRALGVSQDHVLEDYLLTTRYYLHEAAGDSSLPDHVRRTIGTVHPSYLEAAFDAITTEYGTLETYFVDGLGVGPRERAEIRRLYTER